jgi:hypothetical protein
MGVYSIYIQKIGGPYGGQGVYATIFYHTSKINITNVISNPGNTSNGMNLYASGTYPNLNLAIGDSNGTEQFVRIWYYYQISIFAPYIT